MRKLLALVGMSLVIGQTAQAVGPVYTVPAQYDKMVKAVEGLLGKNLDSVNSTQAQNIGANIRSFVEGATGKSVSSTYSPSYFSAYGNNYRQFVTNAAGTDPGATTSATNFTNAGRNYRNLAEGMTGTTITSNNYYYYANAGRNTRDTVYTLSGYNPATTTNAYSYPTKYSAVGNNVSQFKQRSDQTFYDMYINPDGVKKAFTTMDTAVTTKTADLTPITTSNKAEFGGGGIKLTGVYKTGSACIVYSSTTDIAGVTALAINNAIRACKSAGYDGGIIVSSDSGSCWGAWGSAGVGATAVVECYIKE